MATPSAILNVLLKADTADATAKLSKYDKQLAAVDAKTRKGIETRLSGTYNPKAFEQYTAALDKAAARAKNREAFKAELGANFNNRAFNQYQRALEKASAETEVADAKTRHFNGSLRGIGTAAKIAAFGVAAAVAGAGAATIAFSVSFDRAMRNVNSIAQLSEKQFKSLEKQVLELAKQTAQSPKTLAEGLYDLVSSGFKANDAVKVLAASAKAATAGLTDTATSTKAVAAVLNAYHRPAADAAKVSDTLFQTVNLGVISFEQLANTIGDVLPFAAQLHVSLNEVGAAVSTMTKAGISPAETMTRIKNVFVALLKPGKDLSKAIKETGASSGEALIHQKGFQGALEAIIKTTDGSKSAVAKLFPNIRALGGALALTGINTKGANADLKQFGNTSGATNKALSQQTKSVAYQWQKFSATIQAVAIQAGQVLLPAMNKAIGAVSQFVQGMVNGTGAGGKFVQILKDAGQFVINLFNEFQKGNPLLVIAVGVIGGIAVALEAATVAAGAFAAIMAVLTSPILLVVAAVGAIVGALALLYLKNKAVHDFLNKAWNDIKNVANAVFPVVAQIASTAFDVIKKAVTIMVTITKIQFDILKALWLALYDVFIKPQIAAIVALIHAVLIPAFNAIKGPVKDVGKVIGDVFSFIWHKAIKPAMDFILGAFADLLQTLATVANVKLPFVGKIFGNTGKAIQGAADNVRNLKDQLDGLPKKKSTEVDVKVNFLSNVAGAIDSISTSIVNVGNKVAGNVPRHYSGGMVTQPGYFAGEEAPQHPEVILATNPAYRERNLGLWAAAGHMLGVPGFAKGGVSLANAGSEVAQIDPWTGQHAGSWMAGKAKAWIKGMFPGVSPNIASLAGLWQKGGGPGGVADIAAAIAMAESGGRNIKQQGQPYATTGWGLWQITPGNSEPQFGVDQALLIPINNARAAVAKYNQAGGNFNPWTTYRDGAYKAFLGGGGAVGGAAGATVGAGGLGRFDGLPVASWIIPELLYAQKHGWRGRITSGYRPGFDPHAPSGSEHALTQYPGGAVDFGGMVDPAGLANKLAFMAASAGYKGLRLLPASGFRDDGHMSGTGHYKGGVHGRMPHFARGGIFGKAMRTAGRIRGFAKGGITGGLPSASSVLGLPALPPVNGGNKFAPVFGLVTGARGTASSISGDRAAIAGLEQSFNSIDSYYSTVNPVGSFVDPDTGLRDEHAIKQRIDQLNVLIGYRQKIFNLWSAVVSMTQQLIASYGAIIARLRTALKSMSTRGLKGNALQSMQRHIQDTKTAIAKYGGKLSSARGDLTTAIGDRQSAWISLQGLLGEKFGVAGTVAQPSTTSTDLGVGTGVDTTGVGVASSDQSSSLLAGLLQTAQQNYAVSQAQYNVLQKFPAFGGSFAQGGVVPGPIGQPRTIIAHGGETVTPHGGHSVRVELHDHRTRVFVNDVEQVVQSSGRRDARNASRNLAGSRRRIGGL